MIKHTCQIEDREYNTWSYSPGNCEIQNPMEYKLFNGDEISVDGPNVTGIIYSPVRNNRDIPGILLLENNRTFGRTPNKKRLYYKCKPYDTKLPHFLVPFDIPIGFNKNYKNKYVTFSFSKWDDKHPIGVLSQTLGDVYDFKSYCEYILYCKQLHSSIITSISKTKQCLIQKPIEEYKEMILNNPDMYGEFMKRKNEYIFSIDPEGCRDRDDALSITYDPIISTTGCREYKVSVYIANVWVWLELFELWEFSGNRVSTIYLPHMKRPMLPFAISEKICSLDADGNDRFGFVMDFVVFENPAKNDIRIIGMPTLNQCCIKVAVNYNYEEEYKLRDDRNYQLLKTTTEKLDGGGTVKDSHDVVAFWMTQMNYYCAKLMKQNKIGIFRTAHQQPITNPIPSGMPKFMRILEQHISGSYKVYSDTTDLTHETLGLSEYVHFTSPIRRLVDLLNQIKWVMEIIAPPLLSDQVTEFYETQIGEIDELNSKMKKIRRIQSDCDILFKATGFMDENMIHDGIVVSIDQVRNKYTVYIEELKWMSEVSVGVDNNYKKFDKVKCTLYVFENEEQMKRKIRIQII